MTIQPYNPPLPAHLNGQVAQDTLTQYEYQRFKEVLPSWRDQLIAKLLRNTGLRVNELLGIQVRDFVLEGPAFIVYVKRSKKGQITGYDPIYINPDLGVQLRDYVRVHDYKQMESVFGGGDNRCDPRKITARGLRYVFESAGLASIGRKVKLKDFRSFFFQTMVDGGVPMTMASKMVGHESAKATQAHYYKLSVDRRRVIGEGIPV